MVLLSRFKVTDAHARISPETFIYFDDIIGCRISKKSPAVVTFESVEPLAAFGSSECFEPLSIVLERV